MKKIKLTKRWKNRRNRHESNAMFCGCINLRCYYYPPFLLVGNEPGWAGIAQICGLGKRTGPIRRSAKAAQQDAERLGVELLRDIRDGTKALMDQYGMEEDD